MQPNVISPSSTLSAVGVSAPLPLLVPRTAILAPSILVFVSSGAVLTYNIEVTGDDVLAPGYSPATGNWQPIGAAFTGLSVSAVDTLGATVTAVRLHVTAWTSGTATLQFPQLT